MRVKYFFSGLVCGIVIASAFSAYAITKYESASRDAVSVVVYGYSDGVLTPVAVTADGNLITQ